MANPSLPPGDDATIPDEALLWRRIPPLATWWQKNPINGQYFLTSAAFDDPNDGTPMSVAIADHVPGGTETFLQGYVGNGIAQFAAGYARHTCGFAVARDPVEGEPWHAHVIGKKIPRLRKLLREGCTMILIPSDT